MKRYRISQNDMTNANSFIDYLFLQERWDEREKLTEAILDFDGRTVAGWAWARIKNASAVMASIRDAANAVR